MLYRCGSRVIAITHPLSVPLAPSLLLHVLEGRVPHLGGAVRRAAAAGRPRRGKHSSVGGAALPRRTAAQAQPHLSRRS